jgi:hypothetical protein
VLVRGDPDRSLDEVEVVETDDGLDEVERTWVRVEDLPALVARREVDRPRWTWDCATRWYPGFLQAGVRVERCWDLRLTHDLLRGSPLVAPARGEDSALWDSVQAADSTAGALFDGHDQLGLDVLESCGVSARRSRRARPAWPCSSRPSRQERWSRPR